MDAENSAIKQYPPHPQCLDVNMKEAVWPSGLGRWCNCNPVVPGSRPPVPSSSNP